MSSEWSPLRATTEREAMRTGVTNGRPVPSATGWKRQAGVCRLCGVLLRRDPAKLGA